MSKTGCIISHEGIEYLCGLIRDINGLDTNLIDDLNIKSNGTFSSVRINTLLNALKTDCNDFAFSLVSNLSRLELKIVTDEADIVDSNILYLHKPTGQTSYNQYVVIEGNKVLLGTTDINMTDYYTITQADNKFVLKTDFDALKTEVDKVKTTLGTDGLNTTSQTVTGAINELKSDKVNRTDIVDNITSTDTDKPLSANQGKVLKDEVNLKANDDEVIKKTDITTTIDSTSTDTQVPSASAIYHKSKNGITEILTNNDIIAYADTIGAQMVTDTVKIMNGINSPYGADNISNDFHYTIYNINNENFKRIVAYDIRKNDMYMIIKRNGTWSDWQRVCTTNVADVPVTDIVPADTTTFVNFAGRCNYSVKNGICHVSMWGVQITSTGGAKQTGVYLPKCLNGNAGTTMVGLEDGECHAYAYILQNGGLQFDVKDANINLYGTFSYPVA